MSRGTERRRVHNAHDSDEGVLYSIGSAANVSGFHPQTLRWYEKQGLIKPLRTRGNARRYSAEDIARLARIRGLTKKGAGIEAVRLILALEDENKKLCDLIASLQREIELLRASIDSTKQAVIPPPTYSRHRRDYRTGPAASGG
jgi:MerR family transcriptional regulator/heat shock protein HspR